MRARALILVAAAALAAVAVGIADGSSTRVAVVVIDPGHDLHANLATEPIGPGSKTMKIKDGGGTSGVVTHTPEAVVNLAVGLRLRALLLRCGVKVVMTRTTTSHLSMGNIDRAEIANRAHANLFIRIHADGDVNHAEAGAHTLYPASIKGWTDDIYSQSLQAAKLVQAQLFKAEGFPDLGLERRSDITGFNWSNVPVILPEIGFLTNPTEDRILSSPSGQARAAFGLCRGVIAYLSSQHLVVHDRCA
jgi:N-acetylmuramoyl-L-alanine amidase